MSRCATTTGPSQKRPFVPSSLGFPSEKQHFDFSDLLWRVHHLRVCFQGPGASWSWNWDHLERGREQEEINEVRSDFLTGHSSIIYYRFNTFP